MGGILAVAGVIILPAVGFSLTVSSVCNPSVVQHTLFVAYYYILYEFNNTDRLMHWLAMLILTLRIHHAGNEYIISALQCRKLKTN